MSFQSNSAQQTGSLGSLGQSTAGSDGSTKWTIERGSTTGSFTIRTSDGSARVFTLNDLCYVYEQVYDALTSELLPWVTQLQSKQLQNIFVDGYSDWLKHNLEIFGLSPASKFSTWFGKHQQMQALSERQPSGVTEVNHLNAWIFLLSEPVYENFRD